MNVRSLIVAVLGVSMFVAACGSNSSDSTAGSGGAAGGSGGAAGTGGAGGAVADDAGSDAEAQAETGAALEAPVLTELMKMMGALHVNWTNTQADCDSVEGERKDALNPYAVVFSVPGTADNKMDADATQNQMYTYRLRCKKGSDYSPYSNELSANPLQ